MKFNIQFRISKYNEKIFIMYKDKDDKEIEEKDENKNKDKNLDKD